MEASKDDKVKMKPMAIHRHIFAYITLGLLCGWYFFIFALYPTLVYLILFRRSMIAGVTLFIFFILTFMPLKFKPWEPFMYCWIWNIWCEYFDFTYDIDSLKDMKEGERYVFFEFPHGIFPMGQFLSASHIKDITPGRMICGTGADIIFQFPIMRQIMAWIGTRPAKRSNISKILDEGNHLAIIPGGIAEMYLVSADSEGIYFKKRKNTVKAAIQEGANIIPVFFFGNTKIFENLNGSKSWFAKISRKLRASIVFFYGRQGLPIPFRHPIRMVSGDIVKVTRKEFPSDEDLDEVMEKVIESVKGIYEKKKPSWEKRPLIIS